MGSRLIAGVVGGLVAGVVFGAMLHMLGMIAMIGGLVGSETAATGWVVHLAISAAIGLGYALTFGALRPGFGASTGYGLLYGAIWWVLGPLLLMPLLMGMDPFPAIGQQQIMSLVGHAVYGLVLGVTYVAVRDGSQPGRAPATSRRRDRQVHA